MPQERRPCLLLVDDTPANIDILVGLLKSDYDLKVANRGAKALKICATAERIDLILLDVMMPEMDGYEVCRRLRQAPATRHVPVIFLTAKAETDDVVRGFELGANDYVTKPFRPPELLARVRTHLMLQEQQREIAAKNVELKEMLHIICHDVANQLAVAQLSLDLAADLNGTEVKQLLPRIRSAVRNGIGLAGLVRELRRAEDKSLLIGPVSLRSAVAEALLLVEDRAAAKQVMLKVDVPDLTVRAEAFSLVNSVFGNLLTNAVKFSQAGGVVAVTARVEDEGIWVSVRDHGIGMPAAILEHLFDVTKSISRLGTAGEKGTGFGMPLIRKFALMFGGSVVVSTRDRASHPHDHGTEISVLLKRADPAVTDRPAAAH